MIYRGAERGRAVIAGPRKLIKITNLENFGRKILRLKSSDPERRRKEFVLSVMLVGLICTALISLIITLINSLVLANYQGAHPLVLMICLTLFMFLYWLRYWYLEAAIYLFVLILAICGIVPLMLWGVALPQGLLICALAITVSGILLDARWAITLMVITTVVMALLASLQEQGIIAARTEWQHINPDTTDAIVFAVTFAAIAMVSWLSHRQTMHSLHSARVSERALQIERNSLELKVKRRTRQLELSQLEQMLQLQRFAEFGRVSSGLVHDIMNPLAAASLNLDLAGESDEVKQARKSLSYIERYVDTVSRQLRASSSRRLFVVEEEIGSVMQILEYRRRQKMVEVEIDVSPTAKLYGDPVAFSQIIANLVVNAIDAYDEAAAEVPAKVVLRAVENDRSCIITVQDWGVGIKPSSMKRIFDPFYTTKDNGRGSGIGLALAKTAAEKDFGGSLEVISRPKLGTRFTATLPVKRAGEND
ncbi:hypothetical protein EPO04_03575 [Patescibacteria group bacterium]|nr:MAG: hypothetical protein EPO04_03575 [Patescibacteria group bacterium]